MFMFHIILIKYLSLALRFKFLVFKHHFIFLMIPNQVLIILDLRLFIRLVNQHIFEINL